MGHGNSKVDHEEGDSSKHSFRRKGSNNANASHPMKISADDFAGIALVQIIGAEMKEKDKWLACISIGEHTFKSSISDFTDKPQWKSEVKLLLENNGPRLARIAVFETNLLAQNNLVGYCEINLVDAITKELNSEVEVRDLKDPSSEAIVGKISDPVVTQKNFAMRMLSIVDYNKDGILSFSEFSDLMDAFGNQVAANKKEELFKIADKNNDGTVSVEELATLLGQQKESLISSCPVCGETFGNSDRLSVVIHLTLCFDEGTGNQIMTGGFLTEKQASYGWVFKLSEWAHFSSYDIGLNSGSSASNIVVFDRKTKRLVEELIDPKIVLSIRALYQTKVGLCLFDIGTKDLLKNLSEKQGRKMNTTESVKDIPKFIDTYKGQINMEESKLQIKDFNTFNEFFIRELKPEKRPIEKKECDDIAVCAADCRLMAFETADEGSRFWIKGRKFSIKGLLGDEVYSSEFSEGSSFVIFRLAPQDYHRFHSPVAGKIEKVVKIPGSLYTVNPIAVNSEYCNVFTENKREILLLSTKDFGKVALVAIGATMVGSINLTKKEGDEVQKGEEMGYFQFGGSTVIAVFEKDVIKFDDDFVANSKRSLETLVQVGMTLGVSTKVNIERCVVSE
ncbi:phosphatidylserine decarboxylase [Ranunculus cassubicifolius]